jgi:acyl-CoA thioesterase-1
MRTFILICVLLLCASLRAAPAAPAVARGPILVLGDSLSAAFRIDPESGWVALLARRLQQAGPTPPYAVVNASISGETTAGGLSRLPALLAAHRPSIVLVELGSNDGLRGLPIDEVRVNLDRIVDTCRMAGAAVVLIGVELPINYGPQYRDGLRGIYRDAAKKFNAPLVPFLLDGVALDPKLMQDDGLHPLAAAEPRLLDNVWPALQAALRSPPK